MRCPDCNKFVPYDDSNEPEVNDLSIEEDGTVTANVRILLTCAECGAELKDYEFDLDTQADLGEHDTNKKADEGEEEIEHELEVEEDSVEMTTNTTGKGRGMKTFYGVTLNANVKCSCGFETSVELNEEVQASSMNELT